MNKILVILSVFFLCACGDLSIGNYEDYFSFLSKKTEDSKVSLPSSVKEDNEKKEDIKEDIKEDNDLYIYSSHLNKKIVLSEWNKKNSFFNLSDAFVFSFISTNPSDEIAFYPIEQISKEDVRFKSSSICSSIDTSSNQKVIKEIVSFEFPSQLTVLEVVPEEVLLTRKLETFTCSFIFTFFDKHQNPSTYLVVQQPIVSSHKGIHLKLIHQSGIPVNVFSDIKGEDVEDISLIQKNVRDVDTLHLICEGVEPDMSISIKDFKNPFFSYIFFQKNLPHGDKQCRIISKRSDLIDGVSQLVNVSFSDFHLHARKKMPLDNIQYEILREGDVFLTKRNELFSREFRDSLKRVSLLSVIEFSGLPSDFDHQKYERIDANFTTYCSGDFLNDSIEEQYTLPLQKQISFMSITPKRIFQMSRKSGKKDFIDCTYSISIKKGNEDSIDLGKKTFRVHWSSGSYGVSLYSYEGHNRQNSSEKKPYLFFRDLLKEGAGGFNFLFLKDLGKANFLDSYPDKMILSCGKYDDREKKSQSIEVEFPFSESLTSYTLPFSIVFSNLKINDFIKTRVQKTKCRLFFYKNNNLKYFSSEIVLK